MAQFDILKVKDKDVVLEVLLGKDEFISDDVELVKEQRMDASLEKHVPYVEEKDDGYLVKIGKEMEHPMSEEHYIEMIEICVDSYLYRKYLTPTDKAEAYFKVPKGKSVCAREYCNIHGLWSN